MSTVACIMMKAENITNKGQNINWAIGGCRTATGNKNKSPAVARES